MIHNLKHSFYKTILCFVAVVFSGFLSVAQEVEFTSPLYDLEDLVTRGSSEYIDTELSDTDKVSLDPKSFFKLFISEDTESVSATPFRLRLELRLTGFNENGDLLQGSTTKTFELEYSSQLEARATTNNLYHSIDNTYGIRVELISYEVIHLETGEAIALPDNVSYQLGFKAERYYELNTDPMIITRGYGYSSTNSNELVNITLSWPIRGGTKGDIYYDVEWSWIDNYGIAQETLGANEVRLSERDFKINSTRIQTSDTSYEIPALYSRGYLVYRVRAVGRFLSNPTQNRYGEWSTVSGEKTFVSDWLSAFSGGDAYTLIASDHENGKNWQFQASYAEEGKRKDVVSYFDGTLRNRQTVTRINSDDNAIVGEVIYDAQGRPAIEVLPVPVNDNDIKYYPLQTQNPSGQLYNYSDFDFDASEENCDVETPGLSTASGAGKYYSPNNNILGPLSDYIPSAVDQDNTTQGFPFSQIEYTADNTGRIKRKSGVGKDHQLGSDHEMKYFYGQPNSSFEINRLFGTNVGELNHYKKNVVIDPNGQGSISYLDPRFYRNSVK